MDHAARMDRIYSAQRHIYDLTRKYYLFGRDRLIDELDLRGRETVLEVGCGTGRNLIRAARAWPQAQFFGLDISAAMLATARARIVSARLSDRIVLAQGDAATFDAKTMFGTERFDRVVFSYTLSMIPPWREALMQGLAVTAPAGRLTVVDFDTQHGWPTMWRTLFTAWLNRFEVTPRHDLREEVARLAGDHGRHSQTETLWKGYACKALIQ